MSYTIGEQVYTEEVILDQFDKINARDEDFPISPLALSNVSKNRYGNILPYEKTLVTISEIAGDEHTTYINANFVQNLNEDLLVPSQKFICTQAPVEDSIADFWRMVWEYDISLIIMLTGIKENGQIKATRYWPSRPGMLEEHGGYNIQFMEQEKKSDIIVRKFEMWKDGSGSDDDDSFELVDESGSFSGGSDDFFTMSRYNAELSRSENAEVRIIHQVHCEKWEDFGVPDTTSYLIKLFEFYQSKKPASALDPVVVHCSAGVGRTGTFIAISEAIHRHENGKDVSIENIVSNLRTQRMGMVQTQEQYQFIYKVVSEFTNDKS